MPLELRIESDGTVRRFWYGRFKIEGKRLCQNLGVKVAGTPPASMSLKDHGDNAFERSRAFAQAKLDQIVEEARSKRDSVRLVEKLYEIKTGEQINSVMLDELPEEWARIPRKRKPNPRYASQCQSTLKRFVGFVQHENPKLDELARVTRSVARAFLHAEAERGVTAKTWNDTLKLLRATFKHLLPAGAINPFADTPTKETETVFRKPFSPEELKKIVEAAKDDDFIRPIIVTGMCTAMRRGDCCLLKWSDVDLDRRFITVKTAKTGVTVSIPIFPMLYEELGALSGQHENQKSEDEGQTSEGASATAGAGGTWNRQAGGLPHGKEGNEGYVFPEQAQMYLENPDGITWRVKKVLAVALMGKGESGKRKAEMDLPELTEVSDEEALRRGLEYIGTVDNREKRERMTTVFKCYMKGKNTKELVAAAGVSKGSASNYLNEIETHIGCRIVRGRPEEGSLTARVRTDTDLLRIEREDGIRDASVRDFHSFRVTWVTIALTGGVPLELVQKVTGHKTTDIVLKHYFQPGREAFRDALNAAMPKLLTYGKQEEEAESEKRKAEMSKAPKDEMRELIERMSAKASKKDKARLLALLKNT